MDEKDSFLFLLGVRVTSVNGLFRIPWPTLFDVFAFVKAGPSLFNVVELSSCKACRFVLTLPKLFALLRADRGVKNLLNERGVTGGGFFSLRRVPASDTTDGGEEGISCEEAKWTGSDRGTSLRPRELSIVHGQINCSRKEASI
jgi:hypothetical protein